MGGEFVEKRLSYFVYMKNNFYWSKMSMTDAGNEMKSNNLKWNSRPIETGVERSI